MDAGSRQDGCQGEDAVATQRKRTPLDVLADEFLLDCLERIAQVPQAKLSDLRAPAEHLDADRPRIAHVQRCAVRERGLRPDMKVRLCFRGGGGYGRPTDRPIDALLSDAVNGYITLEAARTAYGVVTDYLGRDDALVRPPGAYRVDRERTAALRARMTERRD